MSDGLVVEVLREFGYAGTEAALAAELRRLLEYERHESDKPPAETPTPPET